MVSDRPALAAEARRQVASRHCGLLVPQGGDSSCKVLILGEGDRVQNALWRETRLPLDSVIMGQGHRTLCVKEHTARFGGRFGSLLAAERKHSLGHS